MLRREFMQGISGLCILPILSEETTANSKVHINIKICKLEEVIYFSADDVILALRKNKRANRDIETLIDALVSMKKEGDNKLTNP